MSVPFVSVLKLGRSEKCLLNNLLSLILNTLPFSKSFNLRVDFKRCNLSAFMYYKGHYYIRCHLSAFM